MSNYCQIRNTVRMVVEEVSFVRLTKYLFLRSSVCLINLMHCMFIKCATVCTAVDDIFRMFVMQVTQLSL